MRVMPVSGTPISDRDVITLLPARSTPLGYHRPAQRGNAPQIVLYFGTCIEVQNRLRSSEEANF
jgi:hypothetical protein